MSIAVAFLYFAVAVSGAGGMALEMAASRLMLPFYGDSHIIWANIIGLVLAALTVGYYVGGAIVDRWPSRRLLSLLVVVSGLWTAVLPLVGSSWMAAIQNAFPITQTGFVVSSLLGVLILFALPTFLLGCVPPFAIRLAMADVRSAGYVAGRVYAVSTVGSMFGTFAPVLWLMPNLGVRTTFTVVAVVLLLTATLGLVLPGQRPLVSSLADSQQSV